MKQKIFHTSLAILFYITLCTSTNAQQKEFEEIQALNWQQIFFDKGDKDWQDQWFLDGKKAIITNGEDGMLFAAGPVERENASHAVLWTKRTFSGDIKIEYDFTKVDHANKAVNIMYIQATGKEQGPYEKDISAWSHLREIPKMSTYFNNMKLWHISYAAFGNGEELNKPDYVRARRYPVIEGKKFKDTQVGKSYDETGLFKDDVQYHMTFIKKGDLLMLHVKGDGKSSYFSWDFSAHPSITEGRIGLRHMWTRASRYANFSVSHLE